MPVSSASSSTMPYAPKLAAAPPLPPPIAGAGANRHFAEAPTASSSTMPTFAPLAHVLPLPVPIAGAGAAAAPGVPLLDPSVAAAAAPGGALVISPPEKKKKKKSSEWAGASTSCLLDGLLQFRNAAVAAGVTSLGDPGFWEEVARDLYARGRYIKTAEDCQSRYEAVAAYYRDNRNNHLGENYKYRHVLADLLPLLPIRSVRAPPSAFPGDNGAGNPGCSRRAKRPRRVRRGPDAGDDDLRAELRSSVERMEQNLSYGLQYIGSEIHMLRTEVQGLAASAAAPAPPNQGLPGFFYNDPTFPNP